MSQTSTTTQAATDANANAKRARNLGDSGALSQQEITRYMTAEGAANARIASAKANLTAQQLRLKYTKVVAPDSGVISARSATVGSVVGVGAELFRMIRQGPTLGVTGLMTGARRIFTSPSVAPRLPRA